ncbi:MAG TPA: hypothetical protein PK170_01180 [Anaerolineae bacterium]|nr:hypothetical protein [Anaerolineae bacterium]
MTVAELYPTVRLLPRAEKLRLMQFLVVDLAQEEGIPLLTAETEYPVWTPLNAFETGDALFHMLQEHKVR